MPPLEHGMRRDEHVILEDVDFSGERLDFPGLSGARMLRELREHGYAGGYTAVIGFLRDVRPRFAPVFEVCFETTPGEQGQVDFAQFQVVFTDEPEMPRIVWLFSMVLGFICLIWVQFIMQQDLPTVLRCHVAAFDALGGAPRELLYGRMKNRGDPRLRARRYRLKEG